MATIDLTHPVTPDMPVYPGMEPPVFAAQSSVAQDGYLEKKITFYSHTGTHVDAPAHMIADGKGLDRFDISHFHGTAVTLSLPGPADLQKDMQIRTDMLTPHESRLLKADFLLIHTGWSRYWQTDTYFSGFPVLSPDAARWLTTLGLKGIGFDAISADRADSHDFPVHHILLGKEILIIENLTGLDGLPPGPVGFSCFPMRFLDADGSPVRAVAFVPDSNEE
ncbi:MAG: cyclase family protein [Desulfobacter sp.]